jgi:PhzF family phenazine biosynthesis protein
MGIPLLQIDAFASAPFTGNPAAVCLLDGPRDDAWMANVAAEMNLSETAFLLREEGEYRLRWFTPTLEVSLCGHATLASAFALWEWGELEPDREARFRTKSGVLTAAREGDWIELDFPSDPETQVDTPTSLQRALGVDLRYVGKSKFFHLCELESEEILRRLQPDFKRLTEAGAVGTIVTSKSDNPDFDFVSRFFAPGAGINEDPVTGSAHCCLGPYWGKKLGKTQLVGYQASVRGGVVRVRLDGERVRLGGKAVLVFRGELVSEAGRGIGYRLSSPLTSS